MNPKLKNLLLLLNDEKTQFQVLQREITPHITHMQQNDLDQACVTFAFKKLQDEWIKKKARFN